MSDQPSFVVATPGRSVCDDNARALAKHGLLRFQALGTRRGAAGVPLENTRLNPAIGLVHYMVARCVAKYPAESFRFRLHPWFDHWVRRQLLPGNHIISSFGYANASFRWVRQHGGKTLLDGGNSHPQNFWAIMEEEHKRWHCAQPPVARHHYERSLAMLPEVDFVLSPSPYVTRSFLERGFKPGQILRNVYPVNLAHFSPAREPRPLNAPLRIICSGSPSLRKGTPYLLAAFRLVLKKISNARLLLSSYVHESVQPMLRDYADLPIDWSPILPHAQLAERLRSADIYVLPSLEEGLARTTLEALACGLPVIITENSGGGEFVKDGRSGDLVPIRDPEAIAEAIFKWADKILGQAERPKISFDANAVSFETFERVFLEQLKTQGLV